jgi:DNA-binding NtrC family response regulator
MKVSPSAQTVYSACGTNLMKVQSRKRAKPNNMLFVDDEPSIRLTLAPILEESGFHVRLADSVTSALKEISAHKFDVILSDLNISEPRDGFSVVKAARSANPFASRFC